MKDLSVIIPARNEEYLNHTIQEVLEKSEMDTEVIVIADGEWPMEPIKAHPRLTLVYHPESVGQRAACNEGARLSSAKYIMKLDAHCKLAQGYDRVLIENYQKNWVVVPRMYNLHVFDWACTKCEWSIYQGPTPEKCPLCESKVEKKHVWQERLSRQSDFMRFDSDLRFAYWGSFKERPEAQGDLAPTMCLLGACWFLEREYYWELDGMDEGHGSWGQMGVELACKAWLSGGALMVNKKTWFAHMFRTQGGDFSFPYHLSGRDVEKARRHSRDTWAQNKWPKAKHDLQWLIDKFSPIPGWHPEKKTPRKAAIYYTDNRLESGLAERVRQQIGKGIKDKHVVSVSLKPMTYGRNYVIKDTPGYLTMAKQILTGLEALDKDETVVFFLEHDVLYHPKHFDFVPPREDTFYYNTNVWRVRAEDGFAVKVDDCRQLSGLVAYKGLLIDHFKKRIAYIEEHGYSNKIGFEPGTHGRIPELAGKSEAYQSKLPNLDIRHDNNLTPSRWSKDQFRNRKYTEGWAEGNIKDIPGWEGLNLTEL